jgi:peptidyl-prolyl cis-trans isomerase-like 4
MALLLETTYGDLVVDLDIEGSPELCKNVLKLAKARVYTKSLLYHVNTETALACMGCPYGTGLGGACIYGYIDAHNNNNNNNDKRSTVETSQKRFLKSQGRSLTQEELCEKGRLIALPIAGVKDTIGSQLALTLANVGKGERVLPHHHDNNTSASTIDDVLSIGQVVEDNHHVLDKIAQVYTDTDGRPYVDIRILRALVVYDPFDDPPGLEAFMTEQQQIIIDNSHSSSSSQQQQQQRVISSPSPERPPQETVPIRMQVDEIEDDNLSPEQLRQRQLQSLRKEDHSRAVVLEMLGDLPDANITAPETVLFVCKLNPTTQDDDLQLIFSRFDPNVKVDIVRDYDTKASLQYAFCEFTTKEQATEAYFKMNNVLVDDRRIKVDFSQSVSHIWDKFRQRLRNMPKHNTSGGGFAATGRQQQRQPRQEESRRYDGRGNISRNDHYDIDADQRHRRDGHGPSAQRGDYRNDHGRRTYNRGDEISRRGHRGEEQPHYGNTDDYRERRQREMDEFGRQRHSLQREQDGRGNRHDSRRSDSDERKRVERQGSNHRRRHDEETRSHSRDRDRHVEHKRRRHDSSSSSDSDDASRRERRHHRHKKHKKKKKKKSHKGSRNYSDKESDHDSR